jgi:hypothetical protein
MGLFRSKREVHAEAASADVVKGSNPHAALGFVGQPQN